MEDILPVELKKYISGKPYTLDRIGQSDSKVLIFCDMVLKIRPDSPENAKEAELLLWLKGKLPAPELLECVCLNGKNYMLMTKVGGKMACDDEFMVNPQKLISTLADGIRLLWSADVASCPVSATLDQKLASAKKNVDLGLVDTECAAPGIFGKGGFPSPEALLLWLKSNRPEEDLVFSHGDFCLPNVLLNERGISGFIDLGRGGVADRWNDIAICHRSLTDNYVGRYSRKTYEGFDPDFLFSALEIQKDPEKILYYRLLDELA